MVGMGRLDVAALVAFLVGFVMLMCAFVSVEYNYSEVRFLYYMVAFLFMVVGDHYEGMGRKISAVVMYTMSALASLKVVLWS